MLSEDLIERKTLGELCEIKRGRVISTNDIEKCRDKVYPVFSSKTINNGEIGKIDTYDYDGEYITWTTDGAYAGTVFFRNGKFSITNICGLLTLKDKKNYLLKYIYYYFQFVAKKYVMSGSGNPKLMSNVVKEIDILLPSIDVQKRIVEILDQFETVVNSITVGLPKEIELRQKQYEYYRNKLLSFECDEKM